MSSHLRKVGALGQSAFQTLCHRAGLAVNPAVDDQEGWDFLVEFPAPESLLTADRAPKGPSALIQVKSTSDFKRRTWQVKLSNALRFAKNLSPCFTVLLVFGDGDVVPSRAYVSHFWERDIERALAASRAGSVNGKMLHRETFTVRFDEMTMVPIEQLVEHIRVAASTYGPHYATVKQNLIDAAGIAEMKFRVQATFERGTTCDQLLEAMLGEGEPLKASSFKVTETRFGISAHRPDLSGPATIKIEPTRKPLDVVISRSGSPDVIRLSGQATLAQIPIDAGTFRRLKVKADFLEFATNLDGVSDVRLCFSGDASYTMAQLRNISRLSAWVSEGPVDIALEAEVGVLLQGQCEINEIEGKPFWRSMNRVISELLMVFPLDRWPTSTTFTPSEFYNGLEVVAEFVASLTQPDIVWTFGALNPVLPKDVLRTVPALQAVFYLDFGELTLFAITLAPLTSAEIIDGAARITLGAPEILYRQIFRGNARINWERMKDAVMKIRSNLPSGLMFCNLADDPP